MAKMLPLPLAELPQSHIRASLVHNHVSGPFEDLSQGMCSFYLEPPLRYGPQILRLRDHGLGTCFRAEGGDLWQNENHLLGTVHAWILT